jgi:hypothetical protein
MAFEIDGFWSVDVKPFGPVQLYVTSLTVLAVRFNVLPARIGPLFPAVGAVGVGLTATAVVPAADGQPFTVTVTLYVPLTADVAFGIEGFCWVELKLLGPVQL